MATVTLSTDVAISLTDLEAIAKQATREGIFISATLTPEQLADAFFQLTTQERAEMFNSLAKKSLSLERGWDGVIDELLRDELLERDSIDLLHAPASHPAHSIRPGDSVTINVECDNSRASFRIGEVAVVARLDRTGTKLIFSNGIVLDAISVAKVAGLAAAKVTAVKA